MKLLKSLMYILLIAFVTPFVVYVVFSFTPGLNSLTVSSGSMEPAIQTGSVIFIRSVNDFSTLSKGDVITFQDGQHLTTHRIIEIRETNGQYSFITKGDANEDPDPRPVGEEEVVGKELFSIPYLGYILSYSDTLQGMIILILIPALLLITAEFENIMEELDISSEENIPYISTSIGVSIMLLVLSAIIGYTNISEVSGISYINVMTGFLLLLAASMLILSYKAFS